MRLFLVFILCACGIFSNAQEKKTKASYVDLNYFRGNIALHNDDILHLISGHPEGVIISWNKKTFGHNEWEQRFNYPDYGISFSYQDLKNSNLGLNYDERVLPSIMNESQCWG